MGLTRPLNQSVVHPDNSSSGSSDNSHYLEQVPESEFYLPVLRKLISENEICFENGLFIVVFSVIAIVLIVGCATARRRRLSTFTIGSVLVLTYFAIGFGFVDPHWSEGKPRSQIISSYCFFNMDYFVQADLRINIGLSYFNVSYSTRRSISRKGQALLLEVNYQERFNFAQDQWSPDYWRLADAKEDALRRGLPNPIISVAEYLGTHGHGFEWGPKLTAAGEGAKITLEFALAVIVLATVLLVIVPEHGLLVFPLAGILMVGSCVIYWCYSLNRTDLIYVEGISISIDHGRTLYLVFFVGILDIILGMLALLFLRFKICLKFSTFLELNYDTPWANLEIIDDMKMRRQTNATDVKNETVFRKSVRRLKSTVRRGSLPTTSSESTKSTQSDPTPVISVTNFDDLSPRKHHLLRETVKRFRSLSGQRRKVQEIDQNLNGSFCESGRHPPVTRVSSENFLASEIVRESVKRFRKPISRRLSNLKNQETEERSESDNLPDTINSALPDLLIDYTANGAPSSLGLC